MTYKDYQLVLLIHGHCLVPWLMNSSKDSLILRCIPKKWGFNSLILAVINEADEIGMK